jgi:hypothetical protein
MYEDKLTTFSYYIGQDLNPPLTSNQTDALAQALQVTLDQFLAAIAVENEKPDEPVDPEITAALTVLKEKGCTAEDIIKGMDAIPDVPSEVVP